MQGRRRLAAGSRTVYRRYLRKFICVIPRVHGGYFESSSRVIQREFIRKVVVVLFRCLADLEAGLEGRHASAYTRHCSLRRSLLPRGSNGLEAVANVLGILEIKHQSGNTDPGSLLSTQRSRVAVDGQQLPVHWIGATCSPWSYVDCPAEGLWMFGTTSSRRPGKQSR